MTEVKTYPEIEDELHPVTPSVARFDEDEESEWTTDTEDDDWDDDEDEDDEDWDDEDEDWEEDEWEEDEWEEDEEEE